MLNRTAPPVLLPEGRGRGIWKGDRLMRDTDAIPALLADIKELLCGIALLILAGIFCLLGAAFPVPWGIFLLFIGLPPAFSGVMYVRHGFHRHEVVEHPKKQD